MDWTQDDSGWISPAGWATLEAPVFFMSHLQSLSGDVLSLVFSKQLKAFVVKLHSANFLTQMATSKQLKSVLKQYHAACCQG